MSAKPVSTVADIKAALYAQTFSPVLWSDSVSFMADDGVDAFLEIGPGEVLSGLNKRIRKGLTLMAAGTPEMLEAMAAALRAS